MTIIADALSYGLPVRVILLPTNEAVLASPNPKTLLERLRTVEKINAAPDLSENHEAFRVLTANS